jgi:hypothetical protein
MRISYTPQSLYETPAALKDNRYRAWLMDFSFAAERLTGTNPIKDLALARVARRWFLAGLTPYEAVNARQRWHRNGHMTHVALPDTCVGCNRPNSTIGGRFCATCREE